MSDFPPDNYSECEFCGRLTSVLYSCRNCESSFCCLCGEPEISLCDDCLEGDEEE